MSKDIMNCSINGMTISDPLSNFNSCWDYWRDGYYPQTIIHSWPVYLQEKAKDSGKQAFEIIKVLQDKKLIKLDKVSDFIEVMDTLIKIL